MDQRMKAIEEKLDTILKLLQTTQKKSPSVTVKKTKSPKITKSGSAIVTIYNDLIIVTGNTYSNKDNLKSVGARWNKQFKGWQFNSDLIDNVREKVTEVFDSVSFKEISKNVNTTEQTEEDKVSFHDDVCNIDSDSD
tara:strand:- start:330 stop:740 length:411 start_codon:yes stop_codon:yes gene_type:complete